MCRRVRLTVRLAVDLTDTFFIFDEALAARYQLQPNISHEFMALFVLPALD